MNDMAEGGDYSSRLVFGGPFLLGDVLDELAELSGNSHAVGLLVDRRAGNVDRKVVEVGDASLRAKVKVSGAELNPKRPTHESTVDAHLVEIIERGWRLAWLRPVLRLLPLVPIDHDLVER